MIEPTEPVQQPVWQRPVAGTPDAKVVIVCDPQNEEARRSCQPLDKPSMEMMRAACQKIGFKRGDVKLVALAPPIPKEFTKSAKKRWQHVLDHMDGLREEVEGSNPDVIVTLGDLASRSMIGRAVKITKVRGVAQSEQGRTIFPMLSPSFVNRVPEHRTAFAADVATLKRAKDAEWDWSQLQAKGDYEWCTSIRDLLDNPPRLITVDTETTSLRFWDEDADVLTVQIGLGNGRVKVCPVNLTYWPELGQRGRARLIGELRELLENRRVKKAGHNIKYDHHMLRQCLGINTKGWYHDTQLMAFGVDENLMSKALDNCVRVFVPEMAGYSDGFDQQYDKARMIEVPRDDMLDYGGGDADACFRLMQRLEPILRSDPKQWNVYRKIQLPAILTFATVVERFGIHINQERLREFGDEVQEWVDQEYNDLIRMVPAKVRRKQLDEGKPLNFTRDEFIREALFSKDGWNLKPKIFTPSTEDLPTKDKVPSASRDHLMYFVNEPEPVGEFCNRLRDFQQAAKLLSTYVGKEEEGSGFWQYISSEGLIHPSYSLTVTNTGRTASRDPNGQNFPKRGRFAKAYNHIFEARDGFSLIAADLSQIELRIAAWMAMERTMLRIYREGGDIHAATAKAVMGLSNEQWNALDPETRKLYRFRAKAVNFGFLYGMGWRGFMIYAKTDYGLDYSEDEAQHTRETFFNTYSGLPKWHEATERFAKQHGYVRALHGARRNLPSIWSNDPAMVAQAVRQAINAPVQRFGSDLGVMGMNQFSLQADPRECHIVGFIHDQLVAEVVQGKEIEYSQALRWSMENLPLSEFGITPPLPIMSEVEIGLRAENKHNFGLMEETQIDAVKPEWWLDDISEAAERFHEYQYELNG